MEDVGQTKVSTAEPRPDLGDQFFERIGLVAEALAEGPCESAGMARPVNRLVATRGRIVIHAAEGRSVRQLDMIEGRCDVGLVSAMANGGRDSREEDVDRILPPGRDRKSTG